MADSGAIRAGKAFVELFADDGPLRAGLDQASRRLRTWGRSLRRMGTEVALAGGTLFAPALASLREFGSTGEQLANLSASTRETVENLSALSYAAQSVGGNLDTVSEAAQSLNTFLIQASRGGSQAQEELADLGLTIDGLASQDLTSRLRTVANSIAGLESPALQAEAAQRLLGGAGTRLLPILRQGAAGIDQLTGRARAMGLVMSGEDAEGARQFQVSLRDLWSMILRVGAVVGSALVPPLKKVVAYLGDTLPQVIAWIQENRGFIVGIAAAGAGVVALGLALFLLGHAITLASIALAGASIALALLLNPFVAIPLLVIGAVAAALYFSGAWEGVSETVGAEAEDMLENVTGVLDGIADALAAGRFELAAKIAWLGIKAVWMGGVNNLAMLWNEFTSTMDAAGILLGAELTAAGISLWADLKVMWLQGTHFVQNLWFGMVDAIRGTFADLVAAAKIAWEEVQNLNPLRSQATTDANIAAIRREQRAAHAGIDAEASARGAGQGAEIDEVRQAEQRALQLNQQVMQALIQQNQSDLAAQNAELQEGIDDARRELDEAVAEAAQARLEVEAARARAVASSARGGIDNLAGLQSRGAVSGTFSAAQAAALGGGTVEDRIDTNTRRAADLLREIRNAAVNGGIVWGV